MGLAGLDDLRSRDPLVAVVRLAMLVHPTIDVGLGYAQRAGKYQAYEGYESQHKGPPRGAVSPLRMDRPLNSVTAAAGGLCHGSRYKETPPCRHWAPGGVMKPAGRPKDRLLPGRRYPVRPAKLGQIKRAVRRRP